MTTEKKTLEKRSLLCYFPKYARYSNKTKKWAQSWRNVLYEGDYKLIEYPEYGEYELYHLRNDVTEKENLFNLQPEKAQLLKQKLARRLIEIEAPKLQLNPNYELK
ncbi:MAG: hypothetical protein NE330_02560 [Lentisphaeraceae bacterium]|nr:hypothetical protein [Lentisphaeraceae bacterium]